MPSCMKTTQQQFVCRYAQLHLRIPSYIYMYPATYGYTQLKLDTKYTQQHLKIPATSSYTQIRSDTHLCLNIRRWKFSKMSWTSCSWVAMPSKCRRAVPRPLMHGTYTPRVLTYMCRYLHLSIVQHTVKWEVKPQTSVYVKNIRHYDVLPLCLVLCVGNTISHGVSIHGTMCWHSEPTTNKRGHSATLLKATWIEIDTCRYP